MRQRTAVVATLTLVACWGAGGDDGRPAFVVPKTWEQKAIDGLQLPLADHHATPAHLPADYYYKIPARRFVKTYPVYHPAHEPKPDGKSYLDWVTAQTPEPLPTDFSALRTEADWHAKGPAIGKDVFETPLGDDRQPAFSIARVADVRDPEWYTKTGVPYDDRGVVPALRYLVGDDGVVKVGSFSCAMCHTRVENLPGGRKVVVEGAQGNFPFDRVVARNRKRTPEPAVRQVDSFLNRFLFGAPWIDPDPVGPITKATTAEVTGMYDAIPPGTMSRHGSSLLSPVQVPDLIGVRDRKYLDRTGLVRHRGAGDLMRYAALNQGADFLNRYGTFVPGSAPPGPPAKWGTGERPDPATLTGFLGVRYTDEQLYALALYLYSLKPPDNPHAPKTDAQKARVERGARVFAGSNCASCHDPAQGFGNNKLVRAAGFSPPDDHPERANVLNQTVGTDPTLATRTRRGTGLYKVPSLTGVWYRGPFEHNGSVASLEDWFDPGRLADGYVPTGWKGPPGTTGRAVPGHEFGLDLSADDRAALIAYLRTL